jgi:hypothetical protein
MTYRPLFKIGNSFLSCPVFAKNKGFLGFDKMRGGRFIPRSRKNGDRK